MLILDDEIDTAGTMTEAVRVLRAHGCKDVKLSAYHPLLNGPALDRLRAAAGTIIEASPEFRRLLKDVGARVVPAPTKENREKP